MSTRAPARLALASFALAALASLGAGGCKRHKPPVRSRIWLGASHACAQQKSGELECWGANAAGQLGDGTKTGRMLPAAVIAVRPSAPNGPSGPSAGAASSTPDRGLGDLALGARHTCAIFGGAVQCWGDGSRAQLGGAAPAQREGTAPSVTVETLFPLAPISALAASGDRTCALTGRGVRCWGDGIAEPAEPEGFHGVASVVAVGTGGHVCAAFTTPKAVLCAGADDHGQAAARKPLLGGATVVSLTAGKQHTCAVLEDGTIECWGANDAGQLGDGTTTDSAVPALVHGLPPALEVRAGASHTCARLRNNTVACWGANAAHQLANGTTNASSKPAPVTGLVGVQELAVAGDSACARLADGGVRCWGANDLGQLGDGTMSAHDVPMPVKAGPAPTAAK